MLVNVIHDEIVLETPISKTTQIQPILQHFMIDGMSELVKSVPIIVDTMITL